MDLYSFVFRGNLAQQSLDLAGRNVGPTGTDGEELSSSLSVNLLDPVALARARRMAHVFVTIAAFENMIRDLIEETLLEAKGADWWESCVNDNTKNKAKERREQEGARRFHTQRGGRLLDYIDFGDLSPIIVRNWPDFEEFINTDTDWVKAIFKNIESTRNVVMHGGTIELADVHRVGMAIRDWVKQVGG